MTVFFFLTQKTQISTELHRLLFYAKIIMKRLIITAIICGMAVMGQAQGYTLDECIKMARDNNRALQNSQLSLQSSKEMQKEMRTKYLPEISANFTAFHSFDKLITASGTLPQELVAFGEINPDLAQMAGQPFEVEELNKGYSATLSAMLPLYAGGQIMNANKMAKLGYEISELQLSLAEKDITQSVTETYWHLAQIKYNLRTIEQAEKQLEGVLRQVNDFVETGLTTSNSALKVRLRQQELASNRLKLENAEKILRLLLSQQIGVQEADIILPSNDVEQVMLDSAGNGERVELRLAGKAVEAQQLQVKLQRGECLPTVAVGVVGFNTGFGGVSENVSNLTNTNITNGLALATVSVPISNWLGGSRATSRAKLKLRQQENDYLDAKEKLDIDTESSRLNAMEAWEQIQIARTSVSEASENLRQANDLFNVGKTTITDLLDAETLNRQALDRLSSAIAEYQIKVADWKRKVE